MGGNTKFRIAVLGLGGVGAYFGGKLAAHFAATENVEVIFLMRGENEKAVKTNGLQLITPDGEHIVRPDLVTSQAAEAGFFDLLLLCVKTYDLAESLSSFTSCVSERTAILPLLNGVDNVAKIREVAPQAEVWNGCAFIVSRLIAPGVVKVDSQSGLLQFGGLAGVNEKLEGAGRLFKEAGINAELSGDIDKTIWEKFIFISSLATLTSFLDTNVGGIMRHPATEKLLRDLIEEGTRLARAKNIRVDENITQLTVNKIAHLNDETTSSMHVDFTKKGRTELASLTGYVVEQAQALKLPAPAYQRLYGELLKRSERGAKL